jgi:hypothetical protein
MGVPVLEVGYTSATTGRGDHEVRKGHVVALEDKKKQLGQIWWYLIRSVLRTKDTPPIVVIGLQAIFMTSHKQRYYLSRVLKDFDV